MLALETTLAGKLAVAFHLSLAAGVACFQLAGFAFLLEELVDDGWVVGRRGWSRVFLAGLAADVGSVMVVLLLLGKAGRSAVGWMVLHGFI